MNKQTKSIMKKSKQSLMSVKDTKKQEINIENDMKNGNAHEM
jgi:hypothetical protein